LFTANTYPHQAQRNLVSGVVDGGTGDITFEQSLFGPRSEQCYKHPGSRTSTRRWSLLPEMLLFEASGQQWVRRDDGKEGLAVKVRLLA